jgi:hypothetical protein
MRLLGTLRYAVVVTFLYPENYNIWQAFCPGVVDKPAFSVLLE